MTKLLLAILLFGPLALPAYALDTCGIGSSVKTFKMIEHPQLSDFELPDRVILQQAELKQPFQYCDDQIDLKPGIDFMNEYIDFLIASGISEDQPEILTRRQAVATMRKLREEREKA
jgi:hypothetical protein